MKVSPSILTSDFLNLKEEIKKIDSADYIHLDIMDGNFVDNLSFGPSISKQVSSISKKPLDVHLMVLNPLKWIESFTFPNTKIITVHYESNHYLDAIKKIKALGLQVGISIKPKTKVHDIINVIPLVDLVLIMSVEPGFGGQPFLLNQAQKIEELIKIRKSNKYNFLIEVDGGINDTTIAYVKNADICVVGSYLFNQKNPKKVIEFFHNYKG
jgi:ribulose-phosphate 3-epimerase